MTTLEIKDAGVAPQKSSEQERIPGRTAWQYSSTFATEFSVMLSQVVLYKLAAIWLGQTGFSEYALARRVIALLQPVMMLGIGVGLPRYLAFADSRNETSRASRYFFAAMLCVGGFTAVTTGLLLFWRREFSYLLFGSSAYQYLIPSAALMLIGMSAHALLYAFLRGRLAVARANILQLINYCLLPLIVVWLFHRDAASLLWYLGLSWTTVSGVMFLVTDVPGAWGKPTKEARELLSYGLQRVPGDFAIMALLSLPAIFVAHVGGIREAGLVAFGLALVNMIAAIFNPVGIILLPRVSHAVGRADLASIGGETGMIARLTLGLSGIIVIVIEVLGGFLIRIYLGPAYTDAAGIVKIVILGAVPLAFYYAVRSVIDAAHYRAINASNLVIALASFLAGSGIARLYGGSSYAVLWSFVGALAILAVMTYREMKKLFISRSFQVPAADSGMGVDA